MQMTIVGKALNVSEIWRGGYYMVLQPHGLQYKSSVPQNVTAFFSKFPILKDKTCQHSCNSAKLQLHNPSS